jgi:hypothetical protein
LGREVVLESPSGDEKSSLDSRLDGLEWFTFGVSILRTFKSRYNISVCFNLTPKLGRGCRFVYSLVASGMAGFGRPKEIRYCRILGSMEEMQIKTDFVL